MLTVLRRISFRHFAGAPFRSLLIVLGIALGVALLIATRSTSQSLVVAFEKMVEHVSGKADVTIRGRGTGVSSELVADIMDLDEVAHASAVLEIALREKESLRPLLILGVDFLGDPYFLPFDVKEGEEKVVEDPLAFVNDAHAILLSKTLAERRGLEVGDDIELMASEGPTKFRVRGILDDSGPAAAFDGQVAVMFLDAAQVAFARGYNVDRIEVAFEEDADPEAALKSVKEIVGERGEVELPQVRAQRIVDLLGPIRITLDLSGVLALFVAMFLIYNAVAIAVAQRRKEVGVLRALGTTRLRIAAFFCVESLVLALPGCALGIVIGAFFAQVAMEQTVPSISAIYVPLRPPPPEVTPRLALEAVALGTFATLLAALLPAGRAAQVDPAASLRSASLGGDGRRLNPWTLGALGAVLTALVVGSMFVRSVPVGAVASVLSLFAVALFAPALLLVMRFVLAGERSLLGVTGKLALVNVSRDLGRSAVNVVALMSAVTASLTMGIWVASMQKSVTDWFEKSLVGDVVVTAGSPVNDQYKVPFSEKAVDKLKDVDGVSAMIPYRFFTRTMDNTQFAVSGFDTSAYSDLAKERDREFEIVEGPNSLGKSDLVEEKRVLLSDTAARLLKLGAGDPLELSTPTGKVEFEVHAVIGAYFLDRPAILLDRKWVAEHWKDESIDSIGLFISPDADVTDVVRRVRDRLGGGEALFVTPAREVEQALVQTVSQSFSYARSIELIALIVALMGVMGTMLAVVLDRTRELGVLRAIGATGRQIMASVTAEAGILGFAAVTLGVLCGALQGAVVLESVVGPATEWRLDYVFAPDTAIRVGLLVVVTSAIAGLLPARRAARIDVQDALSYE